ncbi:MAG: RNA polymerase subunit sigma-70 [Acidimicrobiales bacterium]
MSAPVLRLAQAGDEDAFVSLTTPYRRELHLHCYRMLGSVTDADDLLQETMVAAWRGIGSFAGRSSLRAWLYRIATNRCLNAIRDTKRRPPPVPVPPFEPPEASRRGEVTWLQPYPDAWLDRTPDIASGPSASFQTAETIRLAFVAALQRVPPRQTAVVVLCDVLDFSLAEVATMLETTPTAVKGLLQRARASLGRRHLSGAYPVPEPGSPAEADLAQRFADAFSADDVGAVVALLTDDAWLAMPPAPHEYHGTAAIAEFLRASAAGRPGRRLRLVSTRANGQPAFACYLEKSDDPGSDPEPDAEPDAEPDPEPEPEPEPSGLVLLTLAGDGIAGITRFLDPELPSIFGFVSAGASLGHT